MKRLLLPGIVTIILLTGACQKTLMHMSGLRQPEIESKESVLVFLKSIRQDTGNAYTLDTIAFNQLRSEPFKPGWKNGFRPAQIRIYDKTGEPVVQWASCEGYLKELKTFDSVPPKNINGLNKEWNLERDLKQYYTLDGIRAGLTPQPGYDFYILVYFAKYFPKLSEESFLEVDQYVKKHPELRIRIYKINVDFQEFWGIELQNKSKVQIGGDK